MGEELGYCSPYPFAALYIAHPASGSHAGTFALFATDAIKTSQYSAPLSCLLGD